jgi:Ca2+-binding RTX toxin-like protein
LSFQYSVTLSDPTSALTAAQSTAVLANVNGAMAILSRNIIGLGSLEIEVAVDLSGRTVGSGASLTAVDKGLQADGRMVIYEGAVAELRTGVDPNGSTADIRVTLPPAYLTNSLWLDPDPTTRATPMPATGFDAVSFFLHELTHALGFNGRGDLATGVVADHWLSTYDTFVKTQNGQPVFTGAEATAEFGGAVPLSTNIFNSYVHYGRVSTDGLDQGLMEGSTYAASGFRLYLDDLDLAFLRDIGLTTVPHAIADVGGSRFNGYGGNDTLTGGVGGDTLVGGAGDDQAFGGAGADSITDVSGSNYLRGDDGADRIQGGAGFDDINGNMGDDTAAGGLGDDWVVGGKDNDSLAGEAGSDIVYGNLGNDTCEGGDGNDIVRGGQQDDIVKGGLGDDWLSGDRNNDTITGGAGADTFHTFGDAGIDRVTDFSRLEGDRVQLDPGTTYSFAQVGSDVVITMGGGGQMILVGVQATSLTGDWIFGA